MQYRRLGKTDMDVSVLAFGVSPIGNVFGETDEAEAIRAVHLAIDRGVYYFDVAPLYGFTLAEQRLGKALKGKRDQVFVATKCCRNTFTDFDFSQQGVKQSIDQSLARLKTDHVDVLQIHDVEFGTREQVINEAIPAAREVQAAGKARYIGITGLPVRYLRLLAESATVDTILSWSHYDLVEDELDTELRPICEERGIGLINASPLHQRLLTETGAPEWHRSPAQVLEMGPKIAALCREHGVNVADVAMRFALDYPHIATTIVGMSKLRHVEANVKALEFEIPEGLLDKIAALVAPVKNMMWFEGNPENNIPPSDPKTWVPQIPDATHT